MPDGIIILGSSQDAGDGDSTPLYGYGHGVVSPQDNLTELDVMLLAFRNDPKPEDGGEGKPYYFWKVVDILWGQSSHCNKKFFRHPWAERMTELACGYKYLGIHGCGSSGKCLAPDTYVLMFDGSKKKASQILVGDRLMGDDSTPRTVLTRVNGRSNMVRIIPVKGDPWECNDDHILCIKRMWSGFKSYRKLGEVIDISVKDYLAKSKTLKSYCGLYCVGVDFPSQPVEFDPQIYGIWIGDGSTGRPIIHSHDNEVEVNKLITEYFTGLGYCVKKSYYSNKGCAHYMITHGNGFGGLKKNAFLDFVRESSFGPECTKRILPRYLINSRTVRLKLMAGIIDSDGYAAGASSGPPTYFEIACSYPELSKDIVFLARSLGYRVTIRNRTVKCKGVECKTDRINIMGDFSDLPTLRKKCYPKKLRHNSNCTGFKIEQLGEGDWCGWTLDGNGRFLLGDFTVTHNSDWAAIWAIVNWLCDPMNTLVLATSTSLKDSRKRIWGAITSYYQSIEKIGERGRLVDSIGMIRSVAPDGTANNDRCGIALIPGEKKKEREAIGKIIGMKNARVFMIADELPELSEALISAAQSNLALNPFFQLIGLGNFNSIYDPLGILVTPKSGWGSITVADDEWETKDGYCLRLDGMKSPNVVLDKDIYPRIYNKKNLNEHRSRYGPNSALFWRMCRSFPCPEGESNCIYSEADFIKGDTSSSCNWLDLPIPVCAADPAFTNEGDNFMACLGLFGKNSNGLQTLQVKEMRALREDVDLSSRGEARDLQTARQLSDFAKESGVLRNHLGVDCSGPGGLAFGSILSIYWGNNYLPIKFGEVASDLPVSNDDTRRGHEAFVNLSSELWWMGREFVRTGQIRGITPEIAKQLKARYYKSVKMGDFVKIRIEPKREMKSRIGESPDAADAFLMLVYLCRFVFGFTPGSINSPGALIRRPNSNESWMKRVRDAHSIYENAFTS